MLKEKSNRLEFSIWQKHFLKMKVKYILFRHAKAERIHYQKTHGTIRNVKQESPSDKRKVITDESLDPHK